MIHEKEKNHSNQIEIKPGTNQGIMKMVDEEKYYGGIVCLF
jgi:hypothetical protein